MKPFRIMWPARLRLRWKAESTTASCSTGAGTCRLSRKCAKIWAIPEHFKDNGYETWGRGKIFHNELDSAREYSMWDNRPIYKGGFEPFPEEEYWVEGSRFSSIKPWEGPDTDFPDVKNANAAVDFLQQDHEKPFFLYYGLWRPHSPYTAPKRFFDLYDLADIELPKGYQPDDLDDVGVLGRMLVDSLKNYQNQAIPFEKLWPMFIRAYLANYSFADWNVGRVIEALDNSPYADSTLVVVFSDNGFHNGEKMRWGKATLWEQADYVPLMIRSPETPGSESNATVSLVDVFPTLVDYCGLSQPQHTLDGNSLVPLLHNPDLTWEHPSLTSYGIGYASVRNEQYRYLSYPDSTEELYDHRNDPHEWTNAAEQPALQSVKTALKKYVPKQWAPSLGGRLEVKRDLDQVMRPSMKEAAGPSGS